MDGGELQLEDEKLLWDPVKDGLPKATEDQEDEELLKDSELELCKSYITSLTSTIILTGGEVPPPPTGLRGQVGSPEMDPGSPISDRTLSPVQESSKGVHLGTRVGGTGREKGEMRGHCPEGKFSWSKEGL